MKQFLLTMLACAIQIVPMSARDHLIKTEWGQESFNSLLPYLNDSTHAFSGCTTVAAAQVINYYGFLPSYDTHFSIEVAIPDVTGFPTGTIRVDYSDDYLMAGTFHCPGLPTTTDSLIASIFYSQASAIFNDGTSTSPYSLFGCFNNHYSYDIEAYVTDEYSDANEAIYCKVVSTDEQKEIVKKAIADSHPVIVNGKEHSFIIDGYDDETDEFHFNYGWGEGYNRWATYRSWADGRYSVFIATPHVGKITMPEITESDSVEFHMLNVDTGEEKIAYLQNSWDGSNSLIARFADGFENNIPAGTYKLWLVMPDGSILAPALPITEKRFADKNDGITSYSFIDHPAVFTIDDSEGFGYLMKMDFYYDTSFGYLDMRLTEIIPQSAYLANGMTVVCDGISYELSQHNRKFCTDPIAMKVGSKIGWNLYYKGVVYGLTSNSHYQDPLQFASQTEYLMIHPYAGTIAGFYATDSGITYEASESAMGYFGSENPFYAVLPTEVYANDQDSRYYGPLSSLRKLDTDSIYIGFYYDIMGSHVFLYNLLPGTWTGIDNLDANCTAENRIYNLSGQLSVRKSKGLYIIDGRRVFIK